jgi:hypothetical protein
MRETSKGTRFLTKKNKEERKNYRSVDKLIKTGMKRKII